ncbi:MAG: hypothetical protein PHZ26_04185 [Candidatus Gracilibacteria bacterium]|nr:hypothetical protein [Candidatus Gracilibacteria bacterium]MDD2908926.1 hypothetical protein [Candidatus Gracilibacteria bacterium]
MDFDKDKFFLEEGEEDGKPSKEDRILAAVCYAHFLFLAPFFMQKDTEFLKFHMKQGGILYVIFLLMNFLSGILLLITGSLRFVGLGGLFLIVYTGFGVFVGYKAYLGEIYELTFLKSLIIWVGDKMKERK